MTDDTEKIQTRIVRIDPRELTLLDENARYMGADQFARLVANVKRDGCLTSVPLVAYDDGKNTVISGNHRTKAAIEADLDEIDAMMIDAPLADARKLALQLSHNSIAGEDDPAILARLYEQIEDLDWRSYSGLDDKQLDLLAETEVPSMGEAQLDFTTLTVLFLPSEMDDAADIMDQALALASGADVQWAARYDDHDRILDLLDITGKAHGVKNVAAGMSLLLTLAERHLPDLAEGWHNPDGGDPLHNGWIPTTTVVGHDMPADAAQVVRRAFDRIIGRGEADSPRQALEFLAADYLAGD